MAFPISLKYLVCLLRVGVSCSVPRTSLLEFWFLSVGARGGGTLSRDQSPQNSQFSAPTGDRSGRRPSRKPVPKADAAQGRHGAQSGRKERTLGSPRLGSPRRKQAESRRRDLELRGRERSFADRARDSRKKRDGRASLKEQSASPKKGKRHRRKEEAWERQKKPRCVGLGPRAAQTSPGRS